MVIVIPSSIVEYRTKIAALRASEAAVGKWRKLPPALGKDGVYWTEPGTGLIVVNTWSKGHRVIVSGNGFSARRAERLIAVLLKRL